MVKVYSFGLAGEEEFTEVPAWDNVVDLLLDEKHLSRSALRALDVLNHLALRQQPARATEVAQALGLSPSTADQLLKTLVSSAYLTFDVDRKRYWLGPRLLGLTTALDQAYYGGNRLRSLMSELARQTGCAISISTPFGRMMQLLDFVGPPVRPCERRAGQVFPLFNSAAGSAMLAQWPLETVRALIAQSRDQLGAMADNPDAIFQHLSDVRANGHAFGGLSDNSEKCSIAFALPMTESGIELTLSIRSALEEMSARRWQLAASAQETIASRLAGPPTIDAAWG